MQQVGSATDDMPVVLNLLSEPLEADATPCNFLCADVVAGRLQMKGKLDQVDILCETKSSGWCMQIGLPPCVAQECQ